MKKVTQFESVISTLDTIIVWVIILSSLISVIMVFAAAPRYTPGLVTFASVLTTAIIALVVNILRILIFGVCYTVIQIAYNTAHLENNPRTTLTSKSSASTTNVTLSTPQTQINSATDTSFSNNEARCVRCEEIFVKNDMLYTEQGLTCEHCVIG